MNIMQEHQSLTCSYKYTVSTCTVVIEECFDVLTNVHACVRTYDMQCTQGIALCYSYLV